MKKYENLIEAAFCYVEQLENPKSPQDAVAAHKNLIIAVEVLRDFRAAGEPIFVLRGHDRVAPRAIIAWGSFVSDASAAGTAREHASHTSDQMLAWQEAHPELVKMPD